MNKQFAIALVGQKGGTSKTTTSVSLADELRSRGRSVLLVDADPQRSAQTWIEIGAARDLDVPVVVAMGPEMYQPSQLPRLSRGYDVVIIDCPSRIDQSVGATMRSALVYCGQRNGLAIATCGPGAVDVWALQDTINCIDMVRDVYSGLEARVLITRRSPTRTILGDNARNVLAESGLSILQSELQYRIAYQEAGSYGCGVAQYAPKTVAAEEVRNLCSEVEGLFHGE